MTRKLLIVTVVALCFSILPHRGYAQEIAGTVLALMGKGTILRAEEKIDAHPEMDIMIQDEFVTHRDSRAKLLFRDDTLLTLSEMSRLVVREYLIQEGTNRSRAIYSLLEGKLRAIVERSDLEIHTPTAVAAARGTGFFIWTEISPEGVLTGVAVFDGKVLVRSPFQSPEEAVLVEPGFMTIVKEGQTPSPPEPTPPDIFNGLKKDTHLKFRPHLKPTPPEILTGGVPPTWAMFYLERWFKPGPVILSVRDPSVESLFSVITIRVEFP